MDLSGTPVTALIILALGIFVLLLYLSNIVLSLSEIISYRRSNRRAHHRDLLTSSHVPSISIIAPAYNEESVIVDCVRSMLSLHYSNYEVFVINDGSKDQTLERIIKAYELEKVATTYPQHIDTQTIRGIYKSKNASLAKLTVIDKENGGKSDASNAAINLTESEYIVCCDVDSILEPDSLLKLIKPIIEETRYQIVAIGGIIRIVNSCEVDKGKLIDIKFPQNIWAKFQVLEYIRSFLLGRLAWSKINGLMIVSGALGLYNRNLVIKTGGFSRDTVGEDMELVVRMRNELRGKKHKVSYIPEPLCWTEVPESLTQLSSQRRRWHRGFLQVMHKYRHMFFNPKHKTIGLVTFPYYIFVEWLTPMLEVVGVIYLFYALLFTNYQPNQYFRIMVIVYLFYLIYTLISILMEELTFRQYLGWRNAIKLMGYAVIEPFVYHPLTIIYALRANIQALTGKKQEWGAMKRKGFQRS